MTAVNRMFDENKKKYKKLIQEIEEEILSLCSFGSQLRHSDKSCFT